ncbi:MAG: R3H domain-containing nucleic acid-binding protein [Candidatus Portnoybacteria bacterium]
MENKEVIKKIVDQLLEKMRFEGETIVNDSKEEGLIVNIQTKEASFLIGQSGVNLDALQHVARVLTNKKATESIQFVLDINEYRKQRSEGLKELARNVADQTIIERVAITLRPMSAYERRVIHLALFDYAQVKTESIGEEPERRVVVKPVK